MTDPVARPRRAPETRAAQEPLRSMVTLTRSGRSRRWSVRVVDGTTRGQLEALVGLALDAGEQLDGRRRSSKTGETVACADYDAHRNQHRQVEGRWICEACSGGGFA